jgi:Tfp pilus assembly protein PilN
VRSAKTSAFVAPNLARRPFVNARPVARLAAALWLVGVVLAVANVLAVSAYLSDSREKRERLDTLEAAVASALERADTVEAELAGLDLADLNDRVAFLNRRIAERAFTWGRLFDDLSAVLPQEVRIVGISPLSLVEPERKGQTPRKPGRSAAASADGQPEFSLKFNGLARSSEPLLDFIDALFARPDFSLPDLASESNEAGGLAFVATATYRPRRHDEVPSASPGESVNVPEATLAPSVPAVAGAGEGPLR